MIIIDRTPVVFPSSLNTNSNISGILNLVNKITNPQKAAIFVLFNKYLKKIFLCFSEFLFITINPRVYVIILLTIFIIAAMYNPLDPYMA